MCVSVWMCVFVCVYVVCAEVRFHCKYSERALEQL